MITIPTVFIIGAGGSKPYGFPTGQNLRENICAQYHNKLNKLLYSFTESQNLRESYLNQAKDFMKKFYESNTKSIDLFLSRNSDFSIEGKRSIIIEILEAEKENRSINKKTKFWENDWYIYLYHRMTELFTKTEDYKKFSENKVTFITFNYDRTLENFLFNSLSSSFTQNSGDILKYVKNLSIFHVYGQTGFLHWQESKPIIHFGQECELKVIDSIIENIKIIYDFDQVTDDVIIDRINEADRIYFLGFGYAEENLKLLGIPQVLRTGQKIYGTALDFYEEEIHRTKLRLNDRWVTNIREDIIQENCDCLTLLRKYL